MNALGLRCVNCDQEYGLGLYYRCERCDFPLEVIYDTPVIGEPIEVSGNSGLWRYQPCLPPVAEEDRISLGEGDTPLLHAKRLGELLGIPNLYIKNEGQNPTGSFKDRPTAMGVSFARSLGVDTVVVSSTGNAGASLAAYAARAGMRAFIFVTDRTPPAKLIQMAIHGAKIVPVRGSLSDAFWLAYQAALQWRWVDLTSTFLSPYPVEGDKTVAYELYKQLGGVPDWILIPVSVGPLLVGIYKGFLELKALGLIDRLPRMVASQAAACAPIARAFSLGEAKVRAWDGSSETVAGGIADPLRGYESDGVYTLRVVNKSGGIATASEDEEILKAARNLAVLEGIFCEPTGAVSVAALNGLKLHPGFFPDQVVVSVTTGHGLKQTRAFEQSIEFPVAIDPTLDAFAKMLERDNP
jgi:threonine synthase